MDLPKVVRERLLPDAELRWLLLATGASIFLTQFLARFVASPEFPFEWPLTRIVPLIFLAATTYHLAGRLAPQFRTGRDLVTGGLAAWLLFRMDTIHYVDDAGFVLRYLDHFAEGHWFNFNPEDGPVFGLSGFLYGLVTGSLVRLGLTPENALLTAALAGIAGSFYAVLGILRHHKIGDGMAFLWTAALVTVARASFNIAFSGMESMFHLAICLGAIYAYVAERHRTMAVLLGLAVASKLDAVPLAGALALLYLLEQRRFRQWAAWRLLLLGAGLPLLGYLLLTSVLFGSPFPQSAYAKLYFHFHQENGWFPFWQHFLSYPMSWLLCVGTAVVFPLQVIRMRVTGQWKWASVAPAAALLGVLLLYFVYNPGERMLWYYVLPEALLLLQFAISGGTLLRELPRPWNWGIGGALLLVGISLSLTPARVESRDFRRDIGIVDGERGRIGAYLKDRVRADETVLAAHGLTIRPVRGYVMDATGLNWKPAVDYRLRHPEMIRDRQPDWIVDTGWPAVIRAANEGNYRLDTAFYDITLRDGTTNLIWQRVPASQGETWVRLPASAVTEGRWVPGRYLGGVRGESIRLDLAVIRPGAEVYLGVHRREAPYELQLRWTAGDSVGWAESVRIPAQEADKSRTSALRRALPPGATTLTLVAPGEIFISDVLCRKARAAERGAFPR
ncbi:MAG: hypothetical protein AAGN35_27055 [Bacteroidota bacterium]